MSFSAVALHRCFHEAMTTSFEVIVVHENSTYVRQAAETVFTEIDRLEHLLSRHDGSSDISRINLLKPGESARITPDVFECLAAASWVNHVTEGAFDVTVGPLLKPAGGTTVRSCRPDHGLSLSRVGMRRLELDSASFSVGIKMESGCSEGVLIDLGAIGKGYALDKAADILEEWGINNYLIVAGGSTALASGDGDKGCGWKVGVGGQWGKAAGMESICLLNEALSGSGTEVKGEHIVDPATGLKASGHIAAWSVCPSATVADALSTAFMVMSTQKVAAFCGKYVRMSAFVVNSAGRLLCLKGKQDERTAT